MNTNRVSDGKTLKPVELDWEGYLKNLRRTGTPDRVYLFEHGIDDKIQDALHGKYAIWDALDPTRDDYLLRKPIEVHRFFGIELMRVFPPNGRLVGPGLGQEGIINSWEDFDRFPWPDPNDADYSALEYYEKNLPDNMRTFAVLSLWEFVRSLLGFENFCYKLVDDPQLIEAVIRKAADFDLAVIDSMSDFDCHAAIYLGDDLGTKTSTMLSPQAFRSLFIPWHKKMADLVHRKDKLFFFHSCGQMYELMDDYIEIVKIDAKHSFEENVMPVSEVKRRYGDRLSLLGGMDVDLLARGDEKTIRKKTREILDNCMPGGGYFLGSGNWVTSYIPLESYLAMLDEARSWGG